MADLNWQWTNPDRTEARAGAWSVKRDGCREAWILRHDDFPVGDDLACLMRSDEQVRRTASHAEAVGAVMDSFLAWATLQPEELPRPVQGERVWIELANGEVRTGTVDTFVVDERGAGEWIRLTDATVEGEHWNSTGIWWPTDALHPDFQRYAVVAWGLIEPEPPRLEHREGEYVHFRIISEFYGEFIDGQWVVDCAGNPGLAWSCSPERMEWYITSPTGVISHGFLTGTVTTPQPPEPTTYGYVGTVTDDNGDVWDVTRDNGYWGLDVAYDRVRRSDGEGRAGSWQDVLAIGVFTPVEEEAKS